MREVIPTRLWIGSAMDARDIRNVLGRGIVAIIDLAIEGSFGRVDNRATARCFARVAERYRYAVEEPPMRVCVKCSKKVTDDSKICRDCGAILEDILDDSRSETGSEPKSKPPARSPWTAKPWKSRQEEHVESPLEKQPEDPDKHCQPNTATSAWTCPQCGESVPGTFDTCWKCSTTGNAERMAGTESGLVHEMPHVSAPSEPSELTGHSEELLIIEDDDEPMPSESVCPRCGSSRMMSGVTVQDQGQHSSGKLQVVICGVPAALIFKDRLHGELTANICGDCGHVELRVANPRELYRHYQKSLRSPYGT